MVYDSDKLPEQDQHLVATFFGAPNTGKSTLGYSAEDALLVNFDGRGPWRVEEKHRIGSKTSICKTFDEVRADVNYWKGKKKTVVIDTGGELVEMLKQYVVDNPSEFKGGAKSMGGISLQGYGFVKSLWKDFTRDLRENFDVVYLFHEQTERVGDDGTFYSIVVEGAAKNLVWQVSDIAGRLFINNGQRYLGFTPTEQYSAKSAYGIKGIIEVPELKDGDPNDFLTKLFAKVRSNIAAKSAALGPEKEKYDFAIADAKKIVATVNAPEDVQEAAAAISKLDHGLTSEKEAKAMLKKRMDDLGIIYDKASKSYAYKAS